MQKRYDVRLLTIDSCRLDTALAADTPNLDSLSPVKRAETSGSYTYPAHHAFFIGDLPRLVDEGSQYISGYDQIWRSASARKTDKPIFCLYDAPNIIEHHQRAGYNVQGFGGVGFFNPHDRNNWLPQMFENFHYFGRKTNLHPYQKIPRRKSVFPLGNLDIIVKNLDRDEPYFLFINCPETHIPYDVPGTNPDKSFINLIRRVYKEQNSKKLYDQENLPFTEEELKLIKSTQVKALEWVDKKIGELLARIPPRRPTLTIVCADHGEEMGDHGRFGHAHNDTTVMQVPVWVKYIE